MIANKKVETSDHFKKTGITIKNIKMTKLTPEEKKKIINKLKNNFNSDEVEFHGYNRFVLREPYQVKTTTGEITRLYKNRLFNENCEEILLENEYNSIFMFTAGVAVVCTRENFQIKEGRFTQDRKDGLIDINGKEILPCIYDSIHPHIDGFTEITKDGVKKASNVNEIINGKFDWDKAIKWE
jgi:hypothetical protein